jgi:hypothetical protein
MLLEVGSVYRYKGPTDRLSHVLYDGPRRPEGHKPLFVLTKDMLITVMERKLISVQFYQFHVMCDGRNGYLFQSEHVNYSEIYEKIL